MKLQAQTSGKAQNIALGPVVCPPPPSDSIVLCRGLPEQLQAQSEAAAEEEETGPPLGTKRQYLVVMRHGERMDEIDVDWRETSKRPWDPPLSDKGLLQVRA